MPGAEGWTRRVHRRVKGNGVRRIQTTDDMGTVSTADDQTQHEYVYGPEYVDEFALQSYRDNGVQKSLYMLQDANP